MTQKILYLASIGWAGHRDDNLIQSIVLMSKNIDDVVFPIVDPIDTFQTSTLIFDFFSRPVIFRYNEGGPDLINYIKNNLLAKSSGVLVSLGGQVVDVDYLRRDDRGNTRYLKAIINEVKKSGLPTIYALQGNLPTSDLTIIKQVLDIPESHVLTTYNYSRPHSLKKTLLALFKMSSQD